ncbi:MAG: hypothetical protein ACKVY0_07070 [Prosthecobacter sp.]|uniref:hypothetical protein n=1 Tax=Prosthecobacter sp. TaxID=1965333 RepID=UPI003902AC65
MSVIEVKNHLRTLSSAQRREVTAFLFDLQSDEDEDEAGELARLHAEMDAGKRISLQDYLQQHESLLARGL